MGIRFYQPATEGSSYQSGTSIGFYGNPTFWSNDIYIEWDGTGYWQMEYRRRSRSKYAGQQDEVWSDWGAWQQAYSSNGYTPAVSNGFNERWTQKLTFQDSDFTGSYDAYEYEVRVRTCNASGSNTGAWATANNLYVYYCADWEVLHAYLNPASKEIELVIDPILARPPKGFKLTYVGKPAQTAVKPNVETFTIDADGYLHVVIPADSATIMRKPDGNVWGILIGDIQGSHYRKPCTVGLNPAYMNQYIATPDGITFSEQDATLRVTVPHCGASGDNVAYQGVTAAYYWTDARGLYTAGSAELVKSGNNWVGEIPSPPYGVTVSVDVTAMGGKTISSSTYTVYATKTVTHSMAHRRLYTLTYGTEFFWLGFDLTFNYQTDVDSEIVQLASGRSIARHGKGSKSKISLGGAIVDNTLGVDSKWLPDVETLHEPHDWVLRTPLGERFQISITDVTRDQQHAHYAALTIQMEEVG